MFNMLYSLCFDSWPKFTTQQYNSNYGKLKFTKMCPALDNISNTHFKVCISISPSLFSPPESYFFYCNSNHISCLVFMTGENDFPIVLIDSRVCPTLLKMLRTFHHFGTHLLWNIFNPRRNVWRVFQYHYEIWFSLISSHSGKNYV